MAAHGADHEGSNRGREASGDGTLALGLFHRNASFQIEFFLACQTQPDPEHILLYPAKILSLMKTSTYGMASSVAAHLFHRCRCNYSPHFQSRRLCELAYSDSLLACPGHLSCSQEATSQSEV